MHRLNRERGAAAVEFALLLPVLMVVLLGIIEFGYLFFIQGSVANAARIGVRDYSIHYADTVFANDGAARAESIKRAGDALFLRDSEAYTAEFKVGCAGPPTVPPTPATLELTYKYHSLTGLFDSILGAEIPIVGKGSMRCGS